MYFSHTTRALLLNAPLMLLHSAFHPFRSSRARLASQSSKYKQELQRSVHHSFR